MISYRLVLTRRHVYELLLENSAVAQIKFRGLLRATVTTIDERFDLEATEGLRKSVVKSGEHPSIIARGSSLGRYAVDLRSKTLYWHSLPGRAMRYCWMDGEGGVVARYLPAAGGDFTIEVEEDALPAGDRESVLILGSYLLTRLGIVAASPSEPTRVLAGANADPSRRERSGS